MCAFCCVQTLVSNLIFSRVLMIFYFYLVILTIMDFIAVTLYLFIVGKLLWDKTHIENKFLPSLPVTGFNFIFFLLLYNFFWRLPFLFSQLFFEWHHICTIKVLDLCLLWVSLMCLFSFILLLKDFSHKLQSFLPEKNICYLVYKLFFLYFFL